MKLSKKPTNNRILRVCSIRVSCHPGKIMTTDVFGRFFISFNTITINLAHACLWGLQYPFKNTEQFKKGRCFALRF